MKKLFSKTALTLLELIISILLVSVVLLGVFAINNVLSSNNQDYGQRYLAKSETQTTLNHILNNASLAIGSGTTVGNPPVLDQGIIFYPAVSQQGCFGIHQDPNNTPTNPNDDVWMVYCLASTSYPSESAAVVAAMCGQNNGSCIWYCTKPYNLNDPNARGVNALCSSPGAGETGAGTSMFLGRAFSMTPILNSTTGLFSVTIQNCLNNTAASCSSTGTSSDPANNPEIQLSGSVYPSQNGM